MLGDENDTLRQDEEKLRGRRRAYGFLESQGAYGIGWIASMEMGRQARGGLSWAESAMANGVSQDEVDAARKRRHATERVLDEAERLRRTG